MSPQQLPRSDEILDRLCDLRIPLTFSVADCELIGTIIREEFDALDTKQSKRITA